MFIALRRIERWLHQHIFKVGWLITQDYQTTTILYYTVFLPGVIIHEVILWLAAGMFNVRAERSISWPEPQEVGQLELNFVQLHSRASKRRKLFISLFPLLTGILIVWYIASNIFNLPAIIQTMSSGELSDINAGLSQFTTTPDFWLWIYLTFTIGNTMFPTSEKNVRGWRWLAGISTVIGIGLLIFVSSTDTIPNLPETVSGLINVLQLTCLLLIGIDVLMVLGLGTIEYVIERVTNRSATFRRGKMLTMSREEAIEEREKARERERRRRERRRRKREREAEQGPRTIYAFSFPVPGAPGDVSAGDVSVTELDLPEPVDDTTAEDDEEITLTPEDAEQMADRIRLPEKPPTVPEEPAPDATEATPEPPPELPEEATASQTPTEIGDDDDELPPPTNIGKGRPPLRLIEGDSEDGDSERKLVRTPGEDTAPDDTKATPDTPSDEDSNATADDTTDAPADVGKPFGKAADTAESDDATDSPDTDSGKVVSESESLETQETIETDVGEEDNKPQRFGVTPFSFDETDKDDAVGQRFGRPKAPDAGRQQPTSQRRESRFGTSRFRRFDESSSDDKDDTYPGVQRSRFGTSSQDDDDDRFNVQPFSPPSQSDDTDDTDSNTDDAAGDSSPTRDDPSLRTSGRSPFRRLNRFDDWIKSDSDEADDDEEEFDDDESILRRSRRPASNPFSGLNSDLLGSSRSDDDEEEDEPVEEDTPSLDLSKIGRPLKPPPVRFGSSRPAPKPTTSESDDEQDSESSSDDAESVDDDITYEDIDDYDSGYDDDDYINYDDL